LPEEKREKKKGGMVGVNAAIDEDPA